MPSAKISEITGWTTIEARFAKVPDSPTEWECRYKQTDSDNHVRWVVVEWADRAFWEESDLPYGTTRHDSLLSDGTAVRVYVGPPTPVSGCIPVGSDLFAQAFFESDGVFWHVADSRDPVQESLCGDEVTAHKSGRGAARAPNRRRDRHGPTAARTRRLTATLDRLVPRIPATQDRAGTEQDQSPARRRVTGIRALRGTPAKPGSPGRVEIRQNDVLPR